MHRKMQKRVGLAIFYVVHFFQGCIRIDKLGVIFRVLGEPLADYGFKSFQRLARLCFGVYRTKKSANIGLRGREHAERISR